MKTGFGENKNGQMISRIYDTMDQLIGGWRDGRPVYRTDIDAIEYIKDVAHKATSPNNFDYIMQAAIEEQLPQMRDNILKDIALEWLEMLKAHTGEFDTRGILLASHTVI
jgi:hypothetical protein